MFNITTAKENEIVKPTSEKVEERIFDRYVRMTLEKIDTSISDATGRYEKGQGYKDPKPSQNWKVLKKAENPRNLEEVVNEEVLVWLKIGIKKVAILPDGSKEKKIRAAALIDTLTQMKEQMEAIKANPDSAEAKEFHDFAIKQAKPKTDPKEKYHQGKTAWEYDAGTDSYIAV